MKNNTAKTTNIPNNAHGAPEPELTEADYERVMGECQKIIYETAEEFPRISAENRQAIITETYACGERCKGEKLRRIFRLTGDWYLELHNREVSNAKN